MSYLNKIFREGSKHLASSDEALDYLRFRGVTLDQIDTFGLGYIPDDAWPPYIDLENATEEEQWYWERSRKGSKLKGKLLFPMTNAMGMIQGLQVRSPSKDEKDYWKFNSLRSEIDGMFFGTKVAMPYIWESKEVYIVEGIFDIFPMIRVFPNTLCCGTASLNPKQITFLKRYVDRVHVAFDHDEQGEKFFNKFYQEYKHDFDLINKVSYAGSDPNDSWTRLGEESFQKQFNSEFSCSLSSYDDEDVTPLYRGNP